MRIVRSVVIDCHIEDVFDYLADPRRAMGACVERNAPTRISWRRQTAGDLVELTYELESVWTSTRVTVREDRRPAAPRVLHPALRLRASRKLDRNLRALRRRLERR